MEICDTHTVGCGMKVGVGAAFRSAIFKKTLPETPVTRKDSKYMMLLLE